MTMEKLCFMKKMMILLKLLPRSCQSMAELLSFKVEFLSLLFSSKFLVSPYLFSFLFFLPLLGSFVIFRIGLAVIPFSLFFFVSFFYASIFCLLFLPADVHNSDTLTILKKNCHCVKT